MDGLPITLIVKAPNQQIEDQTIKCKETWTIHDLKGYLSEVYPCKPKKEEQKLIYSGQLLTDSVMLKDVLRRYDGQDTHTVHLVCSVPQNRYKKSSSNTTATQNQNTASNRESTTQPVNGNDRDMNNPNSLNELRRRNVPDTSNTTDTEQTNAETNSNNPNSNNAHINYWQNQVNPSHNINDPWRSNTINPWTAYGYNPANVMMSAPSIPVGNDPVAFAAAQMAWVQQMQAHYMQFYTQMMQNGGAGMVGFQPFLMNQQFQQNISDQLNAANPDQQAANPQQNQVANNNNNNAQVANELENWDWLEYFYLISRLAIMFAIIYFYSSPARFLLVLVTGFFIYLYQIRFFHAMLQNNEAENNNNEPNNNNNDAVVENQQPQQQQQAEAAENAPAQEENNAENNVTEPQNNDNEETALLQANQPSRLAITWTIITSFLTSLLPDAPNAI